MDEEDTEQGTGRESFLELRDARPRIDECLAALEASFGRSTDEGAERIVRIAADLEQRLGEAGEFLRARGEALDAVFAGLRARPADRSAADPAAHALEEELAGLYRRVRRNPGRAFARSAPRRTLESILDAIRGATLAEVERIPEALCVLEPRRRADAIPPGGRVRDVHREALDRADERSRIPFARAARRGILRLRLWTSYEVLRVPARAIVAEHLARNDARARADVVARLVDAHRAAEAELEESWQIVRSNIEVSAEEVRSLPGLDADADPLRKVEEVREIVSGAIDRSAERIATIAPAYRTATESLLGDLRQRHRDKLDEIRRDMDAAADLSVRFRWALQRAATAARDLGSRIARRGRRLGRVFSRLARRAWYRAEDAALRIGRTVGLGPQAPETLLAFADLPSPAELEAKVQDLPPIYRRLFVSAPLRTRELLVGRDKELATLAEVVRRWRDGRTACVAIVGPEGSGKTSLLQCFAEELDEDVPFGMYVLEERLLTPSDVLAAVSGWLGLPAPAETVEEVVQALLDGPRGVIVVEGGHNLMLRVIGGRTAAETFLSIILATRAHVLWMLTCRRYPWNRMDDLLRIGSYFTHRIDTPFHSEKELRQAITLRHRRTGLALRFTPEGLEDRKIRKLLLSHQPDGAPVQEALQDRFFQDLFGASGGNIDAALFYWLLSVRREDDAASVTVRPLRRPDTGFLDRFDRLHRFTLAETLNHGTLTAEEHARIFRTGEARSRVVLEYLRQLHLVDRVKGNGSGRYKVNPAFWHMLATSLESRSVLY